LIVKVVLEVCNITFDEANFVKLFQVTAVSYLFEPN